MIRIEPVDAFNAKCQFLIDCDWQNFTYPFSPWLGLIWKRSCLFVGPQWTLKKENRLKFPKHDVLLLYNDNNSITSITSQQYLYILSQCI